MSKEKEVKEEIKRQRQVQITIPDVQVVLVSEHDKETIDYLVQKATDIMDRYTMKDGR